MLRQAKSRLFSHEDRRNSDARKVLRRAANACVEQLERRQLLAVNTYVNDNWMMYEDNGDGQDFTFQDMVEDAASGKIAMWGVTAFDTITDGIANTNTGGKVFVLPGTYAENVNVNKSVALLGAGAGIDPRTRSGAESVVVPGTHNIGYTGSIFLVSADNVTIDGFAIDGDNPALDGLVNAGNGIATTPDGNVGTGADHLIIRNNIVSNTNYTAIYGLALGVQPSGGNVIEHNLIDNVTTWGILGEGNFYGRIAENTLTHVGRGIQIDNFHLANPVPAVAPLITGNDITFYKRGILVNLQYQGASTWTIAGNDIAAEAVGAVADNAGLMFWSINTGVSAVASNNSVSGADRGIEFWNLQSSGVTVSGGTLSDNKVGVWMGNDSQYGAALATQATISGIQINGSLNSAIEVKTNGAATQLNIGNGVSIIGAVTGITVDGSGASIGSTLANTSIQDVDGNYITLAGGAMAGVEIDATGVAFGAETDQFTLEDRIEHKVDDSALGFVRVKSGNVYVTQSSGSIQRGINAAAAGDTVNVQDGTYTESNITVGQSLTIDGQSRSGVKVAPAAEDQNENSPFGGTYQHGFIVQSSDVTIKDLTIDGEANPALTAGKNNFRTGIITDSRTNTVYNGTQVQDVTVQHVYRRGIHLYSSAQAGSVRSVGNVISGVAINDVAYEYAYAIAVFESNTQITNNTISGVFSGIATNYVTSAAKAPVVSITDNNVSATTLGFNTSGLGEGSVLAGNTIAVSSTDGVGITVQYVEGNVTVSGNNISAAGGGSGIWLYHNEIAAKPVLVQGNIITATGSTRAAVGDGTGIFMTDNGDLFGDEDGDSYATLTGNTISGFAAGIDLSRAGNSPLPGRNVTATITNNTITGGSAAQIRVNSAGSTISGNTLTGAMSVDGKRFEGVAGYDTAAIAADNTLDKGVTVNEGLAGDRNTIWANIQGAVNAASNGNLVKASAGTFVEDVNVSKSIILSGAGVGLTTVSGPIGGTGSTFAIGASNVEIKNFRITREGNNLVDWNNAALNSGGITIQGQALTGANIHDNLITGMRTAIDINNSNGHSIHNNVITNNRTGLILRNQTDNLSVVENEITGNWTVGVLFLDASGGTNNPVQSATNSNFFNNNISGNWYGQIVDRQTGGSLPVAGSNIKNFSGNWLGTTTPVTSTNNSAEPGYATQIPEEFGGTATAPGSQPDIAGTASANIDLTPLLASGFDTSAAYGFQGNFGALQVSDNGAQAGTLGRIQEAVDLVAAGGTVNVEAGTYTEQVEITKSLTLAGEQDLAGNNRVTIESPATLAKSFAITPTNIQKPIILVHDASNVAVLSLNVDGLHQGNNNHRFVGIGYYNAGGAITDVSVTNVTDTPFSGVQHGNAIYAYNLGATPLSLLVQGSTISEFQKNGITVNGNLDATVRGNDIDGVGPTITAQNGIQFGYGARGTADDNNISDIWYTGNPQWTAAGILAYDVSNVSITNNTVENSQVGISLDSGSATYADNVNISGNIVSGAYHAVDVYGSTATLRDNELAGSNHVGLYVSRGATVDAGDSDEDGNNDFTGYTGVGGHYAIETHNTDAQDPVLARGNDFGAYSDLAFLENFIYDETDASGLGQIDIAGAQSFVIAADTVYVDDDWADSELGASVGGHTFGVDAFATIQDGVNYVTAAGTVNVAGGRYVENVTIEKAMSLVGPNAEINPNGGLRVEEAVITTAISDPAHGDSNLWPNLIYINASNVSVEGFTLDGDNVDLTSRSAVNGADIDATGGIASYYSGAHIVVANNILRNFSYAAIELDNYTAAPSGTSVVSNNLIDNTGGQALYGIGVLLGYNHYAVVSGNTITRANLGVQTGNHSAANPGSPAQIVDNTISSYRSGIFFNAAYGAGSSFEIAGNSISALDNGDATRQWNGIALSSQTAAQPNVHHNVIDGNRGAVTQTTAGYQNWGAAAVTITGGSVREADYGVFANNYDGYPLGPNTSISSVTTLNGLTISDSGTGVYVKDNALNTKGATVGVQIGGGTQISSDAADIRVEGGGASLAFVGASPASLTGTGRYIELAFNGVDAPTGGIDATTVVFGTKTGATMTDEELISTENRITHKMDDLSLGLVRVEAGTLVATSTNLGIQTAINLSAANDTVVVGAGTYNEAIAIDKALTVRGAGVGQTVLNVTGKTASISSNVAHVIIAADDVNLGGMTIQESTAAYTTYGIKAVYADNLTLHDLAVTGTGRTGIEVFGSHEVTLRNITATGNLGAGVALTDVDGADVMNVDTSGNAWGGMAVRRHGEIAGDLTTGILVDNASSFADYLYTEEEAGTLALSNNSANPADLTVPAGLNYVVSGPQADGVRRVMFTQGMAEAQALAANPTGIAHDRIIRTTGQPGQPNTFYVYDLPGDTMSVQAAINFAQAGDTIELAAGTFSGNITVTKPLTIVGAGASTIIQSASGAGLTIASDGVTIKDLRIIGGSKGILAASSISNISLQNLTINGVAGNGIEFTGGTLTNVVIDGAAITGNSIAIVVKNTVAYAGLTITDSAISGNSGGGIDVESVDGNVAVRNTTLGGNGSLSDNTCDIVFLDYNGDVTIEDVTVAATNSRYGIQFRGKAVGGAWSAAGALSLDNVTITGGTDSRFKSGLMFHQYGDLNNVSLNDVVISTANPSYGSIVVQHASATPLDLGNTQITTATGRAIYLWGGGGSVDAQGMTIGGVAVDGASGDQLLAISNRITDTIDAGAVLGQVILKSGELYVGGSGDGAGVTVNTIQNAINAATPGYVIHIGSGTFAENITVNKAVTLDGEGAATILAPSSGASVITLTASNIAISDLSINVNHRYGLLVPDGSSISGISLSNITVTGSDPADDTESEVGFYIQPTASVNGLSIANSTFQHLTYGMYFQQSQSTPGMVSNFSMTDSSLYSNQVKGAYIEKLSDATFDAVEVTENGGYADYWNNKWNAGLDINLKFAAYQNIAVRNSTFASNGLGSATGYGAGLAIKARSDGATYGANPATLTGVTIANNFFNGNQTAVRIGEPGKDNAGPTGVVVSKNSFTGNTVAALDNQTTTNVDASSNWWGDVDGANHPSNTWSGTPGGLVNGNVTVIPWLISGIDTNTAAGFQPDDADAIAPDAPSAPDLTTDSGASDSDNITNDNTPTFAGSAEANATVRLFEGATLLGTTMADADGNWSITSIVLADGEHTIVAQATDNSGNQSVVSGPTTITVDTIAPSVAMPGDQTVTEGDELTLTAIPNGTGSNIASRLWQLVSATNGQTIADVSADTLTFTAIDNGTYVFDYLATDLAGNSTTRQVTVTAGNFPADQFGTAISPITLNENGVVNLDGWLLDPGVLDAHTIKINWGDGSTVQEIALGSGVTEFAASHSYLDNGVYAITYDIVDSDGDASSDGGLGWADAGSVTVNNVAPSSLTLNLTASTIDENGTTTLSGSFADPGTLDGHSVVISWGDGSTQTLTLAAGVLSFNGVTHQYMDNQASDSPYTIGVTVTDTDGAAVSNSTSVTVNNVGIVADGLTIQSTIDENGTTSLDVWFEDPGTLDTHTLSINWGDGSAAQTIDLAAGVLAANGITHQYLDNGSYTVQVSITDKDGGDNLVPATATVTVNNVAPAAVSLSLSATTIQESDTTLLSGSFTDPGTLDTHQVQIDWGDGQTLVVNLLQNVTGFTGIAHQYEDNGDYDIVVTVTDKDGGSAQSQISVTVGNVAPEDVAITGPSAANEGQQLSYTGSATDPAGGNDALSYAWTVSKNGTAGYASGAGTSFSFTPNDNGAYIVSLTVSDGDGGSTTVTQSVAVANVAPVVTITGAPATSPEGTTINLGSSIVDPGSADSFTYAWTVTKNGSAYGSGTGSSFTFTPNDEASYVVSLTVADDDGAAHSTSVTIAVSEVAPTVAITGANSVNEAAAYTITLGSVVDPGQPLDSVTTYFVNWGDGTVVDTYNETQLNNASRTLTHTYADNGNYLISVSVLDNEDFYSAAGSRTVSVLNVAPTATPYGTASVNEGSAATIGLSGGADVSSVDQAAGFLYAYDFNNDDVFEITSSTSSFATVPGSYLTDGPSDRVVKMRIIDKNQQYTEYSRTIHVNNVGPIVNLGSDATVDAGTNFTQTGVFTDPGADTWTATVDYGDGQGAKSLTLSANKSFNLGNVYSTPGTYTVTVTVTDDDGGSASDTMQVTVRNTTFQVVSVTPTASGADIRFNRAANTALLNLYDGQDATADLADVTLVGAATGAVRGSLVWNAATNTVSFVSTGGALANDTYTLTLFSRADGWTDAGGEQLDGDSNQAAGGDFVTSFTVNNGGPVLSIPDFARGPAQSINLPVSISNGDGIIGINFELVYDSNLLTINSATAGSAVSGWAMTVNNTVPGRLAVAISAMTSSTLSAGLAQLAMLNISIPNSAAYQAAQAIRFENVNINAGAIVPTLDVAVHKNVFIGDANGDRTYTTGDASLIQRVVVGLDGGFDASAMVDPAIVANVTGTGSLNATDASYVAQKAIGYTVAQIPSIPAITVTTGGVDPTVAIDQSIVARRGGIVNVPVRITDDAAGIQSGLVSITYDTARFDLANADVSAGTLNDGWNYVYLIDDATGLAKVGWFGTNPHAAGTGTLFNMAFHVSSTAAFGSSPLAISSDPAMTYLETTNGGDMVTTAVDGSILVANELAGRGIFYNNSKYDGNNASAQGPLAGANNDDDDAIATDKQALLPGQTATFANYTSYSKGINGVMLDIAGLTETPTAADFVFKVGNSATPGTWASAPAPLSISSRDIGGGVRRVTIIWADNAIQKQWLQVTVKATAVTGLAAEDVFYFGNAIGETGDAPANAYVNATDELGARNNARGILSPAPITFAWDFNRDGYVNATDQLIARSNATGIFTALKLIAAPAPVGGASARVAIGSSARRLSVINELLTGHVTTSVFAG